jgi:uncharacterized protein RhaS with RHS repeats
MTNTDGDIVWEAEYTTWGNTAKVSYKQSTIKPENEVEFQPLRFQGNTTTKRQDFTTTGLGIMTLMWGGLLHRILLGCWVG